MVGECLADDDLATLLSGEGDAAWRDQVERHIDACEACRSLLADLAALDDSQAEPVDDTQARPLCAGDSVDHFEILEALGRGAMGEVYAARDVKLDRKVALKVVTPGLLGSAEAIARFGREARATARFNHPNIVTIHAVGEHRGQPYVALELLEGETLQQRLESGALPQADAVATARSIAKALDEAHRHGVLHRDLKPGNVHVGADGRVRVLDFGLAKLLDEPTTAANASSEATTDAYETRATAVTGTPAYMAPEQWRGDPTDAATDVWALGLILHQMLTGRHPFAGLDARALAREVCSDRPVPRLAGTDIPPELVELVAACVNKDPAGRPVAAIVLERLDSGSQPHVPAPRSRLALGLVAVLAVGGLGLWSLSDARPSPEPTTPTADAPRTPEQRPEPEGPASPAPSPAVVAPAKADTPEPTTQQQPPPEALAEDDPEPRAKPAAPRRRTVSKQELFGTRE